MKIALFASAFHPAVGGVEEVVRQLAHAFGRSGHQAIVITNCWPRDLSTKEEFEGIRIYRLPLRTPDVSFKSRVTYLLTHRSVEHQIATILQAEKIDVINVHCVSANALYGLRASRKLHLPLVVTSHSERTMDATRIFEKSPYMNKVLRDSLSLANCVTACSRDTLDDLVGFMQGTICSCHRVIYNGVNLDEFTGIERSFAHPRPYIFALGRFVRQKGFDLLLQAYAQSGIGETHDLLLAGDGPEKENLQQQIRDLAISSSVQLPGKTDRSQSLAMMAGASFFVLSSRHEGFPMVCLEAMATSKAIVATAVGGVPESVQDGVSGLLVAKEDPAGMADAFRKLAGNPALCQQLGKAGRKRVEALSWDAIAEEYRDVYRESAHVAC